MRRARRAAGSVPAGPRAAGRRSAVQRLTPAALVGAVVAALVAAAPAPAAAGGDDAGRVARVVAPVRAWAEPGGAGRLVARVSPIAPLGGGVVQLRVGGRRYVDGRWWLRVQLPQRPNATWGWVSEDAAQLRTTPYRVRIDRAARRLTVTRAGRVVRSARVVVGAPGSPTPAGSFALSEELPGSPDAFTGAWVLPITAFSGTYEEFAGGPGRIAIHGRGGASLVDPLGTARSHGCIRVDNATARWLARRLEPGTSVEIA